MNAIKDDVIALVHKELESANKMFPLFNSTHEGYAVILEEVEEATEFLDEIKINMAELWDSVKRNCVETLGYEEVREIRQSAINGAIELIQVAAMAQKLIDSTKDPVTKILNKIIDKEEKRIGGK